MPLPESLEWSVRGHYLTTESAGTPIPQFHGDHQKAGICVLVPNSTDATRWRLRLFFQSSVHPSSNVGGRRIRTVKFQDTSFRDPERMTTRLGQIMCTEAALGRLGSEENWLDLCVQIRDPYLNQTSETVCQRILHHDSDRYNELWRAGNVAGLSPELSLKNRLQTLDAAIQEGFILLAADLASALAHDFRRLGGDDNLAQAAHLLDRVEPMIQDIPADFQKAQISYQKGLLYLTEGQHPKAWLEFERSEQGFSRLASPFRLAVTIQQTEILQQMGAVSDAVNLLRDALNGSESNASALLRSVHEQLAWLLLFSPDPTPEILDEIQKLLGASRSAMQEPLDLLEEANHSLNRAFLAVRSEAGDPSLDLLKARQSLALLAECEGEILVGGGCYASRVERGDRWAYLWLWSYLLEGLGSLKENELTAAENACREARSLLGIPRLAAMASGCLGRVYRLQGDLEKSKEAFEQALTVYEAALSTTVGQLIPLNPGLRADTYFRAARVAIELGDADAAWTILDRVDFISSLENARRLCLESTQDSEIRKQWTGHQERSSELLAALLALDIPASRAHRSLLQSRRHELQKQLREYSRILPQGCGTLPQEPSSWSGFRAFALEDEIILLSRTKNETQCERRTRIDRRDILKVVSWVNQALEQRQIDDKVWRAVFEDLAKALLPPELNRLESSTSYALHGVIQGIPIAALPTDDSAGALDDGRWLADYTTIVLIPAGIRPQPVRWARRGDRAAGQAVFVIDPKSNLPNAGVLKSLYQHLAPDARILFREEATTQSLLEATEEARWLHFDAHGIYNNTFPELSSLELYDRPLNFQEISRLPGELELAHLSGCHTGRFPITADSGRYGLAGQMLRRGSHWVIASRHLMGEELATAFNRAFYTKLFSEEARIDSAFGSALASVRTDHRFSVADWAGLLLLGSV